ncbi:MAG: OmpA family protein [Chitinophagaceae bacterium]
MKKRIILFATIIITLGGITHAQILKKFKDKVKEKAAQKTDQKIDEAAQKTVDAPEKMIKKDGNTTVAGGTTKTTIVKPASANTIGGTSDSIPAASPAVFKTYANFDFVPGDTVIFEDDFRNDMDGEFPSHWELEGGQGVLNKIGGITALLITDGNAGWVSPLMKKKNYLGNEWTLEFDSYQTPGAYPIKIYLQDIGKNDLGKIIVGAHDVTVSGQTSEGDTKDLLGAYPLEMDGENYYNKWHHVSIAYKNKQIKVYVDQLRALAFPNTNIVPARFGMGGIGDQNSPLIFNNVRLASGGKMNMLGKKFTDSKIITHGINFDFLKATLRPESMGTLNMIFGVMKDNPDVKFEVGGHTSKNGQGSPSANLVLSQQRSEAVMKQLIAMGVAASRLKAKGYGETKPIADNASMDGQAQNRRVEFVKF